MIRPTHTFVKLAVSPAVYREIESLLRAAGYRHVFIDGAIDMNGIALVEQTGQCPVPPAGWMCSRAPGNEGPCAALAAGGETNPQICETGEPAGETIAPPIRAILPGGGNRLENSIAHLRELLEDERDGACVGLTIFWKTLDQADESHFIQSIFGALTESDLAYMSVILAAKAVGR